MKNRINVAKNSIFKQKKFYVFLIGLVFVGILFGLIFTFVLSKSDKNIILNQINDFFSYIKDYKNINYKEALFNSLINNTMYIIIIWILGLSILGFPIILILLFLKSFIFGFSISSIIYVYGFKGIIYSFLYVFPHQVVMMIICLLLSFYALSFSYKLFLLLFLKKNIYFKNIMKKYVKIFTICISISILTTFYEVYMSTYFMRIFSFLLKK